MTCLLNIGFVCLEMLALFWRSYVQLLSPCAVAVAPVDSDIFAVEVRDEGLHGQSRILTNKVKNVLDKENFRSVPPVSSCTGLHSEIQNAKCRKRFYCE